MTLAGQDGASRSSTPGGGSSQTSPPAPCPLVGLLDRLPLSKTHDLEDLLVEALLRAQPTSSLTPSHHPVPPRPGAPSAALTTTPSPPSPPLRGQGGQRDEVAPRPHDPVP